MYAQAWPYSGLMPGKPRESLWDFYFLDKQPRGEV